MNSRTDFVTSPFDVRLPYSFWSFVRAEPYTRLCGDDIIAAVINFLQCGVQDTSGCTNWKLGHHFGVVALETVMRKLVREYQSERELEDDRAGGVDEGTKDDDEESSRIPTDEGDEGIEEGSDDDCHEGDEDGEVYSAEVLSDDEATKDRITFVRYLFERCKKSTSLRFLLPYLVLFGPAVEGLYIGIRSGWIELVREIGTLLTPFNSGTDKKLYEKLLLQVSAMHGSLSPLQKFSYKQSATINYYGHKIQNVAGDEFGKILF